MGHRLISVIYFLGIALTATPALAQDFGYTVYVNAERVNIRQGAGTRYPAIALLSRGSELRVFNRVGDWLKIKSVSTNEYGWVFQPLTSTTKSSDSTTVQAEDYGYTVYVNADRVNIRQGASTSYPVITSVSRGSELRVSNKVNNWLKVRSISTNQSGWIYKPLTSNTKPANSISSVDTDSLPLENN